MKWIIGIHVIICMDVPGDGSLLFQMNTLITGAGGFVGEALVRALLARAVDGDSLTCVDLALSVPAADSRLRPIAGSMTDVDVFALVFDREYDRVFHLATVPGGWAEKNFDAGLEVNLLLTIRVLEALRKQAESRAVIVYPSSIGVYGPLTSPVDDRTVPCPTWSYGTHKAIGELLIADYSRKGFIDGRTVRLPAVVARGSNPSGAISAFMSDLIRELGAGRSFACPVSPSAMCWWMSRECAVQNLFHAAEVAESLWPGRRVCQLPALRCSIEEIVRTTAAVSRHLAESLICYRPVEEVEERFGKLPPLSTPLAESMGFCHDGSAEQLVRRALAGLIAPGP
jgi:nucleoside-diphosphate-sugar epimerase